MRKVIRMTTEPAGVINKPLVWVIELKMEEIHLPGPRSMDSRMAKMPKRAPEATMALRICSAAFLGVLMVVAARKSRVRNSGIEVVVIKLSIN